HGSWIRLSGSGRANRSASAGDMSSQVANPANPAPSRCMAPIAWAGTSLALRDPNRSTKLIRKYAIFFSFATFARSTGMNSPLLRIAPGLPGPPHDVVVDAPRAGADAQLRPGIQ